MLSFKHYTIRNKMSRLVTIKTFLSLVSLFCTELVLVQAIEFLNEDELYGSSVWTRTNTILCVNTCPFARIVACDRDVTFCSFRYVTIRSCKQFSISSHWIQILHVTSRQPFIQKNSTKVCCATFLWFLKRCQKASETNSYAWRAYWIILTNHTAGFPLKAVRNKLPVLSWLVHIVVKDTKPLLANEVQQPHAQKQWNTYPLQII